MKTDKVVNMQLWNAVEKTDPKYTKEVGFGRKFTRINAQYQIRTATVSTDALTKGLSKLGFNADIFLGKWDDNRYVSQRKEECSEKPVSMDRPHPRNSIKKKMDKIVLDTMLDFIDDGKSDIVQKKLPDYSMTKVQATKINDAIISKQGA